MLELIKGKSYHTMTDSMSRTKEDWFDEIPDHIQAFKSRGGVVYEAQIGETVYNPLKQHAFVINNNTHKPKQKWKEGK